MRQLIIFILYYLTFFHPATAQEKPPFVFKKTFDITSTGVLIPSVYFSTSILKNKTVYTPADIEKYKLENLNGWNKSAAMNYSLQAKQASDFLLMTSLAAPTVLLFDERIRSDVNSNISLLPVMYFEAIALTTLEVTLCKALVNKARPYVYNPDVLSQSKLTNEASLSFFSGHTATSATATFFAASVYSQYHPEQSKLLIYSVASALPLATGYMRYLSGRHFPLDILTGFAIGAVNGYLITRLHRR